MTRQTWTAVVSAITFVVLAAIIALTPLDYVARHPGDTVNVFAKSEGRQNLAIAGARQYPVSGQLRLTTVSVTSADGVLSLPEAVLSHAMPSHDVLPRSVIYPAGTTVKQATDHDRVLMDDSQTNAVVAALRAANRPVKMLPVVQRVRKNSPADLALAPGDFVVSLNGRAMRTIDDIQRAVAAVKPGTKLSVRILRQGEEQTVLVTTATSNTDPSVAVIGATFGVGYVHDVRVRFGIDQRIGGPSAGLVFALAIYDIITPGDLLVGRNVAGTGEIDGDGMVGSIGGIQEKVKAAERAGASVFLFPAANCADLQGLRTRLRMVPVTRLADAISAINAVNTNKELPTCHE